MNRFFFSALFVTSVITASANAAPPATAAEAVRALDLSTFPLLEGAKAPTTRSRMNLLYEAKGDVAGGMKFLRNALTERQWQQAPGGYTGPESANAVYTRNDFRLSVSVSQMSKPDMVMVAMTNHGNVDVSALPVPAGAKPLYRDAISASYVTDLTPAAATEACTKLFAEKGWQPYGNAIDQHFFKQNAVRLSAFITAAPAQGGKTNIQLSTEQLSADLPVPPAITEFHYSDMPTQVTFDTKQMSVDELADFYRKAMTPAGWTATTEKPVKDKRKAFLIFRNAEKDMLSLDMGIYNELTRVSLKFETAAEVAEAERRFEAAREAKLKEKAKPLPVVTVALPTAATDIKETKNRIEFKLAPGKGKAAVDELRKKFRDDSWTEKVTTSADTHGHFDYSKDKQEVTISFIDPGPIPAEVTIRVRNAELQKGGK
jgi:hypothetical protein